MKRCTITFGRLVLILLAAASLGCEGNRVPTSPPKKVDSRATSLDAPRSADRVAQKDDGRLAATGAPIVEPLTELHGPPLKRPRRAAHEDLEGHLGRREAQEELWTIPMAHRRSVHPNLGFPSHGSISVGTVANGHLVAGFRLPHRGPHHVVLAEHMGRATNYATDEMADAILKASADVAQAYPGSVLGIGNISRGGGDRIPWSISHRAGRDADFSFYLLDSNGIQVVPPTLFKLAPPLGTIELDGQILTFDPGRNWEFLRSLLENPAVELQYAFCADFLVQRMFKFAASKGVSTSRLKRLSKLIRQPRGTLPHDDHVHVRIRCSAQDALEGCRDIESGRERMPRGPEFAKRVADVRAIAGADGETIERRAGALRMLGLLKVRSASQVVYDVLAECNDGLSVEALDALQAMGARTRVKPLSALIDCTHSPAVALPAFRLLRRGGSASARQALKWLLDSRVLPGDGTLLGRPVSIQRQACFLLGWTGSRKQVPALLRLAIDSTSPSASAALWALRAITGHTVLSDDLVASGLTWKQAKKVWRRWKRKHRKHDDALLDELQQNGYRVKELSRRYARQLRLAIKDSDHLSLAVQRKLNQLLRQAVPVQVKDKGHAYWLWGKRLRRLGLR